MRNAYDERNRAEQLAVWTTRCIRRERWLCSERNYPTGTGLLTDLKATVSALRVANELMIAHQGRGLRIAPPGDLGLTDDELHLVHGTAASQAGAHRLVEAELFELASSWQARKSLTVAVTMLGAALGAAGHWLPKPQCTRPLPGAALRVARLHGADMRLSEVAWP